MLSAYSAHMTKTIYKICPEPMWRQAERSGVFQGAPIDLADGFIHFSTAEQVVETAAKHFAGLDNLLLVAFDADRFGPSLKYEVSRGGALFPHLYAPLETSAAKWVRALPLKADGAHDFPELEA